MGKTALVTGGTGGLGCAVTVQLLSEGWRVVVPWVMEQELRRLPQHDRLKLVRADLFDPAQVADVIRVANDDPSSPLTAVANLVGGFAMGPRMHECPVEDFEHMLRLNLRPTYLTTQAALPHLIDSGIGSVVAVSASAAATPFVGVSGYATAKAAVAALMSSLAVEYAADGVRFNTIVPSVIDTPGNREAQPSASRARWASPESIATAVSFLLSTEASATTGALLPVPGIG